MFRPQGACSVILLNYTSTIAALVKINKDFKTLKLSSVIKWLLLHEVCLVAVYTICVLVLLLCLPGTYGRSPTIILNYKYQNERF